MPYQIPPWLAPINPVPSFERGVSTGADIASQQNRLELAIQEMTLRREAQQRHDEAQNLAAVRTVQDIAAQQQAMAQKAREAALKWEGQQEYTSLINQGVPPEEAFGRTAHKMIPGQLGQVIWHAQARKDAAAQHESTVRATAAYRQSQLDMAQKRLDLSEKREESLEKTRRTGGGRTLTLVARGEEKEIEDSLKEYRAKLKAAADREDEKLVNRYEGVIQGLEGRRRKLYDPNYGKPVVTAPVPPMNEPRMSPDVLNTALRQTREMGIVTPTNAPAVKRWRFNPDTGELEAL